MNNKSKLVHPKDFPEDLCGFLIVQSNLIKELLSQDLENRIVDIKIVLASCCNTASAIIRLGEMKEFFYTEAIVLARAFLEKIINFCYLLVCEKNEFDKYLKHTIQKSYRKLNRSIRAGELEIGIKYDRKINIETNPVLKEALEEFTSKRGKEKTHWTKKSLVERIEIISKKTKINPGVFLLSTLTIYDDASETLHGTLYGCSYNTWAYEPNLNHKDRQKTANYSEKNISLLYFKLGFLFHEVISILNRNNKIQKIHKKSIENLKGAVVLLKKLSID